MQTPPLITSWFLHPSLLHNLRFLLHAYDAHSSSETALLAHYSLMQRLGFAPCLMHTSPFNAWFVHPSWLHSLALAPCLKHTLPWITIFVHPSAEHSFRYCFLFVADRHLKKTLALFFLPFVPSLFLFDDLSLTFDVLSRLTKLASYLFRVELRWWVDVLLFALFFDDFLLLWQLRRRLHFCQLTLHVDQGTHIIVIIIALCAFIWWCHLLWAWLWMLCFIEIC